MSSSNSDLIVLTTSPAGLGHIRVTQALKAGLPPKTNLEVLGLHDPRMEALHRVTSVNPALRQVMNFVQNNPIAEGGFTRWYRKMLQYNPQTIFDELSRLMLRQVTKPSRLIIVCTHFGMAHQLAQIKQRLQGEFNVPVVLAVIVTDDSPQQIWAVPGIDYEFVPSESTRASLEVVFQKYVGLPLPQIIVVPYPISPHFAKQLTPKEFSQRKSEVNPPAKQKTTIIIPIAGAAVQLAYYQELIEAIVRLMNVQIIVVAREKPVTEKFLNWCKAKPFIEVMSDKDDFKVVELYEKAYTENVITLEVTKPSEQTFKALVSPKRRGGAILLFSEPVGRQEEDNLLFLNRHDLMPNLFWQQVMGSLSHEAYHQTHKSLIEAAKNWRGIVLPYGGVESAVFIHSLYKHGVFSAMMDFISHRKGHQELSHDGVKEIWKILLN